MIRSEIKFRELSEIFNKDNNILITEAIINLREEQPFEGAVSLLTGLYDNNDDNLVRKTVAEFMNDIKDQALAEEIIKEIRKKWKPETKTMLVASCWQSGLNFSDYLKDITAEFLTGNFATAIECFTVIEENAEDLKPGTRKELIAEISKWPPSNVDAKKALTNELLIILNNNQEL
jgi:hypothetical protein